jgi:hypothetical protein
MIDENADNRRLPIPDWNAQPAVLDVKERVGPAHAAGDPRAHRHVPTVARNSE